jgi:hypothetical protein
MARADDLRVARQLLVLAFVLTVVGFFVYGAYWFWEIAFPPCGPPPAPAMCR